MKKKLEQLKKSCIVIDIETSAQYPEGEMIDIQTDFDSYVKFAKVKWVGMYSFLHDEYIEVNAIGKEELIKEYINQHSVLIGFNNECFDTPIMFNNDLMPDKKFTQVDCQVILGSSAFQRPDGIPFKNRGALMGFKFKNNSLKVVAETMKLETQKGDIDFNIFFKTIWNDAETAEIKKYLHADVKSTKEMFDALWDFWMPFTDFVSEKNVLNLSWIRSSIASLRYKGDCHTLGIEETYGEANHEKESMGGKVLEPKYEEAEDAWYIDYGSLYPWIRNMFCIDNEINNNVFNEKTGGLPTTWHGNDMFQVRGYYDISYQNPIALKSIKNLLHRAKLKVEDPTNPLIYAIKIYENAGYGALRSPIFEGIHTPNAGWDICWIGQQINEYTDKRMEDFGFETIAGDTDSVFVILKDKSKMCSDIIYAATKDRKTLEKNYVQLCLKKIIKEILDNVPFPNTGFNIDIEDHIPYIMWPFSLEPILGEDGKNLKNEKGRLIKELRGKKKNYLYLHEKNGEMKLKLVGLPIIKDNATPLSQQILKETLTPMILDKQSAKFPKAEINNITEEYLSKPDAMKGLAREYKVKPSDSYKPNKDGTPSTVIQAQISRGYFGGQSGMVSLIKNKVVGRAGVTAKYCTYEEAVENNLTMEDLDLTKLHNELSPFEVNEK